MKRTFLMIAFAALATIAYSQTDDKGYEEGKYVLKGVSGLNLSQTAMTNWSAGGENSVAGNAYLNGSLTHKNGNWLWVTNLVLDYGLTKTKSQGMRKSTDKIGLSTQLGYSTNNVWFYTLMGDLNTTVSVTPLYGRCYHRLPLTIQTLLICHLPWQEAPYLLASHTHA